MDELEGFGKNKLYVDAVGIRAHFRETVFILGSKVRERKYKLEIINLILNGKNNIFL